MKPELVFEFPTRYEVVLHDRIPRTLGLRVIELPSGADADPQQELAQAPIVEVRPAAAAPWIGIFFPDEGPSSRGTLIGWPDEESLCFAGGDGAYVVHTADPAAIALIEGTPVRQHYVVPHAGIVLFADWTNLYAYDRSGLLWRSARLALDELLIDGAEADTISCSGFFGATRRKSFTVDLRSGRSHDAPMAFGG